MRLFSSVAVFAAAQAASLAAVQTEIHAPGPNGSLTGTVLTPDFTKGPVVLVVPGSGPIDRDGNASNAVRASTYRLLAEGLATHGIASVRIDKRGLYGSRAAVSDPNSVTIGDYADDVKTWISVIRRRTAAPCVWVLGHSEGGLVALAAAQTASDLCGLILVSTAGRPLGAVLREQLRANPANAPILDQALSAIAQLETGQRVDVTAIHPALLPLFRPEVQGFLINEFSIDPAKLIATCRHPILIVQGDRDIQVGVGDAQRLKQANPTATLAVLAHANHVLKSVVSDDRDANVATYSDPDLPLAPGVVDVITSFISVSRKSR
jgi:pimeloyl-ACP methyl ester carboxylesterase